MNLFEPSIISVPVTSSSEKQELTACVPGRSIIFVFDIVICIFSECGASTVFPGTNCLCVLFLVRSKR